MLDHVSSG